MATVLFDLRMVESRLHGIARYALELVARLPRMRPEWTFLGLTGPRGLSALGPLTPDLKLLRCPAAFLSVLEQPALTAALVRSRCDIFHATSFSVPALGPGRLVATLHDANHLAFPENFGLATAAYYRFIVGPRLRRGATVLTVSNFSRRELARELALDSSTIRVTPLAADARFTVRAGPTLQAFIRDHGLSLPYFAVVGNAKAHKNLGLLAQVAQLGFPQMALACGPGVKVKFGFPEAAVELPELSEDELALFYAGATALLLPSRYEGFGLPALEAMASGCPVLAADAGALPETVGDAGVLLSPDEAAPWVSALTRVSQDIPFRETLIRRGLARSRLYSWEQCAQQTLAAYDATLDGTA